MEKCPSFNYWPRVGICFNLPLTSLETCELPTQFRGQWQVGGLPGPPSYSRAAAGRDRPHHTHIQWPTGSLIYQKSWQPGSRFMDKFDFHHRPLSSAHPPDFRDSRLGSVPHSAGTHFQATTLHLCGFWNPSAINVRERKRGLMKLAWPSALPIRHVVHERYCEATCTHTHTPD